MARSFPDLLSDLWNLPVRIGYGILVAGANAVDLLIASPLQKLFRKTQRMGYFFVLPNMVIFSIFILFPVLLNIYFALTGGVQIYPKDRPFVGLQNFQQLFTCTNFLDPNTCSEDRFWHGIYNTFWFVVFEVGGIVLLSLLTALVLNRKVRARGFFRSVYFYPVLLSPVVVALIWKWILQREGLLNAALQSTGMSGTNWLLDANWAFFWTVFVSIWAHMGFYTLILLAGLQAIPRDIYEAASMDAATPWRTFRRVTLPLLMPSLAVVFILGMIRAVQIFDEVYVLTGGGPGTATTFMVEYIYTTGFAQTVREYGIAAAASLLLAAGLLVF